MLLSMFSSCPTWFSCRIKQTSRICEYQMWCSRSARWWVKVAARCLISCERSLLAGRRRLIATSMQTTRAHHAVWWKYCLVWKTLRLKGSCHSGRRGCGSGTRQRASSVSLRQQRDTGAVFWRCWSVIYRVSPQRFEPWMKMSSVISAEFHHLKPPEATFVEPIILLILFNTGHDNN